VKEVSEIWLHHDIIKRDMRFGLTSILVLSYQHTSVKQSCEQTAIKVHRQKT